MLCRSVFPGVVSQVCHVYTQEFMSLCVSFSPPPSLPPSLFPPFPPSPSLPLSLPPFSLPCLTGLDAASSRELLAHLNELAASNRTVVLTIHQPRLEIFHMFDKLVLLSDGKVSNCCVIEPILCRMFPKLRTLLVEMNLLSF